MEPVYKSPEPLRHLLRGLFEQRCRGREQAVTMRRLLRTVDVWRYDRSADGRVVRRAIAELITIDRVPIAGDSAAGYYLCVTTNELLAQCRQLGRRTRATGRRMRIFGEAARARLGGQVELDYDLTIEERRAALAEVEAYLGEA